MEQNGVYKVVSIVEALQPGEDCLLLPRGLALHCFSSEALGCFLGRRSLGLPAGL